MASTSFCRAVSGSISESVSTSTSSAPSSVTSSDASGAVSNSVTSCFLLFLAKSFLLLIVVCIKQAANQTRRVIDNWNNGCVRHAVRANDTQGAEGAALARVGRCNQAAIGKLCVLCLAADNDLNTLSFKAAVKQFD